MQLYYSKKNEILVGGSFVAANTNTILCINLRIAYEHYENDVMETMIEQFYGEHILKLVLINETQRSLYVDAMMEYLGYEPIETDIDEIPEDELIFYQDREGNIIDDENTKIFDLETDFPEIYATMYNVYGIDIFDTDIPFDRFLMLIHNASGDNPVSNKIKIRTTSSKDIDPKMKGKLAELKQTFAIPNHYKETNG